MQTAAHSHLTKLDGVSGPQRDGLLGARFFLAGPCPCKANTHSLCSCRPRTCHSMRGLPRALVPAPAPQTRTVVPPRRRAAQPCRSWRRPANKARRRRHPRSADSSPPLPAPGRRTRLEGTPWASSPPRRTGTTKMGSSGQAGLVARQWVGALRRRLPLTQCLRRECSPSDRAAVSAVAVEGSSARQRASVGAGAAG